MSMCFFFFFSSRRRHTRWNCDWSSDVCSSDLLAKAVRRQHEGGRHVLQLGAPAAGRSEERRVGKECRSRWSPDHVKKKQLTNGDRPKDFTYRRRSRALQGKAVTP